MVCRTLWRALCPLPNAAAFRFWHGWQGLNLHLSPAALLCQLSYSRICPRWATSSRGALGPVGTTGLVQTTGFEPVKTCWIPPRSLSCACLHVGRPECGRSAPVRRFCNEKKHVSIGPTSIYALTADKVNVIMFLHPSTRQRRPFAPVKYSADHPFKAPAAAFSATPTPPTPSPAAPSRPTLHGKLAERAEKMCGNTHTPVPESPAVFPLPLSMPLHHPAFPSLTAAAAPNPHAAPPYRNRPANRPAHCLPRIAKCRADDAPTAKTIAIPAKAFNSPLNPNTNCHPPTPPIVELSPIIRRHCLHTVIAPSSAASASRRPSSRVF